MSPLLAVASDVICSGLLQAIKLLVFALEANLIMYCSSPAPLKTNTYTNDVASHVCACTQDAVLTGRRVNGGSWSIHFDALKYCYSKTCVYMQLVCNQMSTLPPTYHAFNLRLAYLKCICGI